MFVDCVDCADDEIYPSKLIYKSTINNIFLLIIVDYKLIFSIFA